MKKLIFILSLVSVAAFAQFISFNSPTFVASLGTSSSLKNGLLTYYKMDDASGGLVDASGNALTATELGAAPTYGAPGKIVDAVDFTSANGMAQPVYYNGGSVTINCWIKSDDTSFSVPLQTYDTGYQGLTWQVSGSNVHISSGGGPVVGIGGFTEVDAIGVIDGNWHMVTQVVTTDGATYQQLDVYVDGILCQTDSVENPPESGGAGAFNGLGGRPDGSNAFHGTIDEFGYWTRALTPAEISALYNGGAGLPFSGF